MEDTLRMLLHLSVIGCAFCLGVFIGSIITTRR